MTHCKQSSKQFHAVSHPKPEQQDKRRGADVCLSPCTQNDRTHRVDMVRHGQGECNNEVLCANVGRKSVRLGTDTKHSEVKKLVLITQRAASKRAFPKRRVDRSENNSETESRVMSEGKSFLQCAALPCFVIIVVLAETS